MTVEGHFKKLAAIGRLPPRAAGSPKVGGQKSNLGWPTTSVAGIQAINTTNGDQLYTVTEISTASSGNGYTLHESGSKSYSRTESDDMNAGTASSTETGTDAYTTLGEKGTVSGTGIAGEAENVRTAIPCKERAIMPNYGSSQPH
jgi:hypothetical protein